MHRALLVTIAMSVTANVHAAQRPGEASDMALGKRVYEKQCASCHGARGEGAPGWEKADANGELPAPPHDASGHTWKHGDGMLYNLVKNGWRDPFNKTLRLTMPAFGQTLTPHEIRAVSEYLKTLWTAEQRRF